MERGFISVLSEYLDRLMTAQTREELRGADVWFRSTMSGEGGEEELAEKLQKIGEELLHCREEHKDVSALSEPEQAENMQVQQLLDLNLFTYHFQPIVRVDNGEIFAYEALMRAERMQGITPFHILKYAELTGRLFEVEQYTFLNVLRIVSENRELLRGRPVFLNSMPNVHILPEKAAEIEHLLEAGRSIVVEMTESSEYGDKELDEIKEKYERLGIPIAIDDFGTGYSNISNLLRYTPNFVKIDRSLLSGIENSPNKKHFVREIIDFCHENGIMALAEGVESAEELRTVILLGADLIQGYYTARPAAEIVSSIPYEIRSEIRAYRQEREDGRRLRVYTAQGDERLNLEKLSRDGYSAIHVGSGSGSITVAGSHHFDSGIHIMIADGYKGTLTLENARLSNLTERPCIDLGNGTELTLVLVGANRLDNSGIRVPAGSVLTLEGQGDLDIRLGSADYYGIGNDLASPHGLLQFRQDGSISITSKSHAGVCIGSGLGGEISIGRGRYVLNVAGSSNIGIGSGDGNTKVELLGCDFECTSSGAYSVIIGSAGGEADIHVLYSSIRFASDSQLATGMGSLYGPAAKVHAESVSINAEMSADSLTVFGALRGSSDVTVERSSVRLTADGARALAFGGTKDGMTALTLTDIDIAGRISTELDGTTKASLGDIHVSGGRYRLELNRKQLENI